MRTYYIIYPRNFSSEFDLVYVETPEDEEAFKKTKKQNDINPRMTVCEITETEAQRYALKEGKHILPAATDYYDVGIDNYGNIITSSGDKYHLRGRIVERGD